MKFSKISALSLSALIITCSVAQAQSSRSSLGPTVKNNGTAIQSKHAMGPTVKNNGTAIQSKHAVGPTVKNNGTAIQDKHADQLNGKSESKASKQVLDLNQK